MLVERPNGSSCMAAGGALIREDLLVEAAAAAMAELEEVERGRMTTSSRSSPECTPLDVSDGARSGGDVELSVDVVSERGVSSASVGTPESARRRHRGVNDVVI